MLRGKLLLDGWAGRSEHPVEIIGETPKRYRVELLCDVRLPSRREGKAGDVVLVPKHAVRMDDPIDSKEETAGEHSRA